MGRSSNRSQRRRWRLLPALVALAAFAGCITPSIPIPPPDPADMTFHLSGDPNATTATFSYPRDTNYCNGTLYLYDRDRHYGIIQAANVDCTLGPTQPMTALAGDQLDVTVQVGQQSVSTCIRLREGMPSPTDYCQ
jgi:hypothetical protein